MTNTVLDHFADAVRENGDAISVMGADAQLTYRELNEKADAVSARLADHGVRTGGRVVVALSRSPQFIIAILAVVKLGAAYVPARFDLDRDSLERLAVQANADCIIGRTSAHRQNETTPVLVFEDLLAPGRPACVQPVSRQPDDCLYIMYTSGSTGAPKGVMVPDRAVVRLVKGTNFTEIRPDDTFYLTADPTFDASTFEIWGALLNGARIVAEEAGFDPNHLADSIERHSVSVLWLTAGLFHILGARRPEVFKPLRQLLAGGDVLNPGIVRRVIQACPGLEVVNGYGPTENTTFTCCHRMTAANPPTDRVPIGTPVTGTTVHLLGSDGRPVPTGQEGTLFAGGEGVALGYLDLPEDRSFTSIPDISEGRLYNTGDRALQIDGLYYFLGRQDSVAKISGYRVSINSVLEQIYSLDYVLEAALYVDSDVLRGKRLIAYLQLGDASPNIAQIREDCVKLMPAYMVPEVIRIVDAMPLNKNGKVKLNLEQKRCKPTPQTTS